RFHGTHRSGRSRLRHLAKIEALPRQTSAWRYRQRQRRSRRLLGCEQNEIATRLPQARRLSKSPPGRTSGLEPGDEGVVKRAMTTSLLAARLVELCRRGEYLAAQAELYADDAVSVEPPGSPQPFTQGKAALAAKTRLFSEMFETRGGFISHPIVADGFFAYTM